jgi:hypothetical protein
MSVVQLKWVRVPVPVISPRRLKDRGSLLRSLHVRLRWLRCWLYRQPRPEVPDVGERMLARI